MAYLIEKTRKDIQEYKTLIEALELLRSRSAQEYTDLREGIILLSSNKKDLIRPIVEIFSDSNISPNNKAVLMCHKLEMNSLEHLANKINDAIKIVKLNLVFSERFVEEESRSQPLK